MYMMTSLKRQVAELKERLTSKEELCNQLQKKARVASYQSLELLYFNKIEENKELRMHIDSLVTDNEKYNFKQHGRCFGKNENRAHSVKR